MGHRPSVWCCCTGKGREGLLSVVCSSFVHRVGGCLSGFMCCLCAVLDMQQTYDMWLKKHNPGKPGEGTPLTSREGEKQIQMPTDYADIMVIS